MIRETRKWRPHEARVPMQSAGAERHWGGIQFERYADDLVCHCASYHEAQRLRSVLEQRFEMCGLQLHPKKN
ncbi:hypothetical protein DN062_12910 [Nitrincola tibetensis]|uniref:Reverse transcriptase domain-containing protein n=2 Tax=Nitrincola tibetensis TaxID=2219697 RepID=A0A364NKL5_9GAMM|nr:hypothetical protein DN062_12910 [Nitrincola tibetensis]